MKTPAFSTHTSPLRSLMINPFFAAPEDDKEIDCMGMPQGSSTSWSIVCEGILSVIVGICGLMGNGATIAVLSRPNFKETFHKLLICLACFDSLFIGKHDPHFCVVKQFNGI